MNIKREQLSDSQIELTISLGIEELSVAETKALNQLAPTVEAKGFRKGKVPPAVAKKTLDPANLAQKVTEIAINLALIEAFEKEDINPLDRPQIDLTKFVPEQSLEFKAKIEIVPPIKLANYKKLKVKKVDLKITKKDVDGVLKRLQQNFAEEKIVKRAAKDGDKLTIDFEGFVDDKPFDGGQAKDYVLELGSKSFIPGFEDGLIGKKTGEDIDLKIKFPKDYHAKALKGKPVTFKTKIKEIKEVKLPELNDKFAQKASDFKTLKEFEADIKKNLLVEKEEEINNQYRNDLVDELAEKSKMTVPEILKKDQMEAIERDLVQNLAYRGMNLDQYLETMDKTKTKWLKEDVEPVAETRVKAGLALAELAKELKIDVEEDEVNDKLAELKAQYAKNEDALQQLSSEQVWRDLRNSLLTNKTIDKLVEFNS